jgi:hypothetical protein
MLDACVVRRAGHQHSVGMHGGPMAGGLAHRSLIASLIRLRPKTFGAHHPGRAAQVADPLDLRRTSGNRLGKRVGTFPTACRVAHVKTIPATLGVPWHISTHTCKPASALDTSEPWTALGPRCVAESSRIGSRRLRRARPRSHRAAALGGRPGTARRATSEHPQRSDRLIGSTDDKGRSVSPSSSACQCPSCGHRVKGACGVARGREPRWEPQGRTTFQFRGLT